MGTFLRSFTFGHIRQLDRVLGEALRRAWSLGAGPGSEQLVIDVDSTICEVCGKAKDGAGYGYTKKLGYHPLLAIRAWTGEVLHARMRKGAANTQRGAVRFVEELVARVRRAGATGELVMRFDSGFWSNATIATLERLDVGYTMGVRMVKSVARAVEAIDESAWTPIDYTCDGEAEVAECDYKGRRLIVRRTRLVGRQATLWPEWRHFAFVTDLGGKAVDVDAFHRAHATVELAIRDLKEGAGLEHVPSGQFFANSAWLLCAALAHDLIRWTAMLGDITPEDQLIVARTVRTRFLSVPGRLVSRSGRPTLRTPLEWPWATPSTEPSTFSALCRRSRCSSTSAAGAPQTIADGADNRSELHEAWSCAPRLLLKNSECGWPPRGAADHFIRCPARSPIGGSRLRPADHPRCHYRYRRPSVGHHRCSTAIP